MLFDHHSQTSDFYFKDFWQTSVLGFALGLIGLVPLISFLWPETFLLSSTIIFGILFVEFLAFRVWRQGVFFRLEFVEVRVIMRTMTLDTSLIKRIEFSDDTSHMGQIVFTLADGKRVFTPLFRDSLLYAPVQDATATKRAEAMIETLERALDWSRSQVV